MKNAKKVMVAVYGLLNSRLMSRAVMLSMSQMKTSVATVFMLFLSFGCVVSISVVIGWCQTLFRGSLSNCYQAMKIRTPGGVLSS